MASDSSRFVVLFGVYHLLDQFSPHSVALTLNWIHTAGDEREGVCLMCGAV